MQPVGAAHVFFAGAFGISFGLLLGPAKREACNSRQTVDENCLIAIEILERPADRLKMRRRIGRCWREALIWSADPAREIAGGRPIIQTNRSAQANRAR